MMLDRSKNANGYLISEIIFSCISGYFMFWVRNNFRNFFSQGPYLLSVNQGFNEETYFSSITAIILKKSERLHSHIQAQFINCIFVQCITVGLSGF